MSIQQNIKMNFFIFFCLFLSIFIAYYIVSHKTKDLRDESYQITELIILQSDMSKLVHNLQTVNTLDKLNFIKANFEEKSKRYNLYARKLQHNHEYLLLPKHSILVDYNIKSEFTKLLDYNKQIRLAFKELYNLEKENFLIISTLFQKQKFIKKRISYTKQVTAIQVQNKKIQTRIRENLQRLTLKLNRTLDSNMIIYLLLIMGIVAILGYKLFHSINTTVTEVTNRMSKEIEKNRSKDELLSQQSKLAAMGEMMGNIAHQWRQPLNAVAGNIQMTEYDYEDDLINKQYFKDFVKTNMSLIDFMSKTIDDFRDFFKSDKKKENFRILDSIEKPVNILKPQLKVLDIQVIISGNDFIIISLQSEFQQVILNIVNNAKDAMITNKINNGKIEIKTQVIDATGFIIIEDNAGGIPEHAIDRIFEPYFTTKEQGKGTGIGLYMSKIIVDNHMRGELSVRNTPVGARFEIKLNLLDVSTYEHD